MISPCLMILTSSITVQSLGGDRTIRAPAVGAKIWCLYVFVRLSRSGPPALCSFEGCIVRTCIVTVNGSILRRL